MQKFTYLLLTLATLLFAEHLLAQEIEYPSNKPILSALSDNQVPGYYREKEKNGIGVVPLYYFFLAWPQLTSLDFKQAKVMVGNSI